MKTLVIGNGGREHALVRGLSRDPAVDQVHAACGNPGIGELATLHDVNALDGNDVATLAKRVGADLVVIGPEAPLVAGVADAVRDVGIACFGPSAAAARIEGSKSFAKDVMAAAGISTAGCRVCRSAAETTAALEQIGPPYVVKNDGLAGGKGVVVTDDRERALEHAGGCDCVVVEEFLDGPEVSLFAVCDGRTVLPMQPAQDFKRLRDGGDGPNTGGMGAYSPLPWAPDGLVDEVRERILQPCVDELARRGTPYAGLLYAGLALTSAGPKVVEFNARFGDPETQALVELLDTPLGELLSVAATGDLAGAGPSSLRWEPGAAVTVVMASAGYPAGPRTGDLVSGIAAAEALPAVEVDQAGTARGAHGLLTAGGRVLAVTATGASIAAARASAYAGVERIHFDGAQYRTDIAAF